MLFRVNKITSFVQEQIPKLRATLDDIEQIFDKRITDVNIADGAITNPLIASGAVDSTKISGTVGQCLSGTYTGDGTVNRIVTVGFTPRYVLVAKQSTSMMFHGLSDGTTRYTQWMVDNAGNLTAGDSDWQGVITNGFKVGSGAAGGLSNTNTVVFWYVAFR